MEVGSIVRVPLSGRRVRGYVVEKGDRDSDRLKDVAAVSGDFAIFDPKSLQTLIWAANHYVAPLSVMLDRASPPNLPRRVKPDDYQDVMVPQNGGPLQHFALEVAAGKRPKPKAIVARSGGLGWVADLAPALEAGQSVMMILATAAEAHRVAEQARSFFFERVRTVTGDNDRRVTEAWGGARQPGSLLIGTPRLATWTVPAVSLVVVVEEGRRAMKDRQTPTLHVRDLMLRRAEIEDIALAFIGPTPSVEVLAAGADPIRSGNRAWSLVETVDRAQEPPGSGYLAERTLAALRGAIANRWKSLIFTHRRVGDASMRCVKCRAVRLCPRCGSRLTRTETCERCGATSASCSNCEGNEFEPMGTIPDRLLAATRSLLGDGAAGLSPTSLPIAIGTERDLAAADGFDLVVVADTDGLAFGRDYRSGEEALRILGRVGNLLNQGTGRRMILQTSLPGSPLMDTLRSGDPIPYMESTLAERVKLNLPPFTEMIAVEARGDVDADALTSELVTEGVTVMGPAVSEGGARWLLQGRLGDSRAELRQIVRRWRDRGLKVRIDADPIDL